MEKSRRNGILCVFALVCVAILLSTSLAVLAGNGNGTNRSTSSYNLESCMHVDSDGRIVAVYDESQYFVGEKERLGERIASNSEIDVGRLTYEILDDHELSVVDYEGSYRNIVVPDVVLYDGETWFVTEIGEWGLSSHSPWGRHPHTVEIGPLVEIMCEFSIGNQECWGDNTTGFKIRDIDESRLTTIREYAFYCTRITSIELPKSLGVICDWAFCDCPELENVILHSETLVIDDYAFSECFMLKEINLENVTYIGEKTFDGTNLTTADLISASVIKSGAFYCCQQLSNVKFSSDLRSLDADAFVASEKRDKSGEIIGIAYDFFDTDHMEVDQCADNMRGKTFVRNDMSTGDFIQVA